MKCVLLILAVLFLSLAPVMADGKAENGAAGLEKKLLGDWKGKSACQGDLTLKANGTFERTDCGPGGIRYAGTWEMKWDALPPTLILKCETSDDADVVGRKEEMKVQELNDKLLIVTYPGSDFRWQFERKMK
jgi:hypothetical protein